MLIAKKVHGIKNLVETAMLLYRPFPPEQIVDHEGEKHPWIIEREQDEYGVTEWFCMQHQVRIYTRDNRIRHPDNPQYAGQAKWVPDPQKVELRIGFWDHEDQDKIEHAMCVLSPCFEWRKTIIYKSLCMGNLPETMMSEYGTVTRDNQAGKGRRLYIVVVERGKEVRAEEVILRLHAQQSVELYYPLPPEDKM